MKNKDKIILSALELFAKNGFTETSVEAIAKHAKVSKGLTYTHFKNKEELLAVTTEKTITKMTSEMMESEVMSFETFFTSFFESLKTNTDIIRLCLLLVVHPQTPSKVVHMLDKQKEELLALLSILLQEKFQDDAQEEAKVLLATIDGITLDYVTDPNPKSLETTKAYLFKKYS